MLDVVVQNIVAFGMISDCCVRGRGVVPVSYDTALHCRQAQPMSQNGIYVRAPPTTSFCLVLSCLAFRCITQCCVVFDSVLRCVVLGCVARCCMV